MTVNTTLESRIIVPPSPPPSPIVNFSIFFHPGHLYSNPPIINVQPFLLNDYKTCLHYFFNLVQPPTPNYSTPLLLIIITISTPPPPYYSNPTYYSGLMSTQSFVTYLFSMKKTSDFGEYLILQETVCFEFRVY